MREHLFRFQGLGEALAFWLNLGSKAEVNELFRERLPGARRSGPKTNLWKLREFVVAALEMERR